ncbi:MAG: hypothetical protein AAF989_16205 [Planctomycetota bacterium]
MSERNGESILQESFLEMRAKLLEVAATLDRVESAPDVDGAVSRSEQRRQISEAIAILGTSNPDRAKRLQHLFSRPYEADWRKKMEI